MNRARSSLPYATLALGLSPAVHACATCFGRSDSAMAEGLNMGILFLLGIILALLAAFASFFIFLARRASAVNRQASAPATRSPHPA
jgi:hypothetical protein